MKLNVERIKYSMELKFLMTEFLKRKINVYPLDLNKKIAVIILDD